MSSSRTPKRAPRGTVRGLRTLGAERKPKRARAKRTAQRAVRTKALRTLRAEFDRVLAMKEKLAAESRVGGAEKGRASQRPEERLRSLVASLEGMSRFALQMGLITPAESRELFADAMQRGLYEGWSH